MRLSLAAINPPNNSYDDHLEPVALYASEESRPAPADCWQCYQPPVYYALASVVLEMIHAATGRLHMAWEAVQWISALSSIGTLFFSLLLLRIYLAGDQLAQLGGLTFLLILPRDLYTAASISNDALLVFFVTATVFFFARIHETEPRMIFLAGTAVFAILSAWTKQSGLVALALLVLAAREVCRARGSDSRRRWIVAAIIIACLLALADEAWRTYQTGIPLASNQHLEYRAFLEDQPPGHLTSSTFLSFLPAHLFDHPTLHPSTVDSFWTQIFARVWFDYEPRFLPQNATTVWIARGLYVIGLVVTLVILLGGIKIVRNGSHSTRRLLLVPVGFLSTAVLQTIRFPHFSSMKALFILPAISVFALCFGFGIHVIQTEKWGRRLGIGLILALLLVGTIHWIAALLINAEALNTSTSPLWPIPAP